MLLLRLAEQEMFPEFEQMCVLLDFLLCNLNANINRVKHNTLYQKKKKKKKKEIFDREMLSFIINAL